MELLEMELRDYWNLFFRQKKIIISMFVAVLVIGLIYIFTSRPVYEANCSLLITEFSGNMGILGEKGNAGYLFESADRANYINTQSELIKKRYILTKSINEIKSYYKGQAISSLSLNSLSNSIKVNVIKGTNLISISYRDKDPELSAHVVNVLSKNLVIQDQEMNQEKFSSARMFIENQLKEQKEKLEQAENLVLSYKKNARTVALKEETIGKLKELGEIEANRMELDTRMKGMLAQKQELENKINNNSSQTNPFVSGWMQSLESVNQGITGLRAQLNSVNNNVNRVNGSLSQLPPKEVELARVVRDQTIANEVYNRLLIRYDEVRINEASIISNIKIMESAVTPDAPVAPDKKKLLFSTVMIGMILSFGFALIREYLKDVPRTLEEVQDIMPYDMLGQLAYQDNVNPLFMRTTANSVNTEAVRLICANLKFKETMDKKSMSILITSALPQEGKTLLTSNLAISFANSGKKVAVVDIDLQRPKMKTNFQLPNEKGITDYLANEAELKDILNLDSESGVTVVTAGKTLLNQSELENSRMSDLLIYLKASYDFVFFDSPPITLVAQTLEFARKVDGIILVVDSKNTARKALKGMDALLKNKQLPILGMVFNKMRREDSGYYYNYYNYNY
ncbi:MAG: hypothetical protein DKM50_01965 [Candidatus Margulisiibacteriota bacterium]|nr:MAG: hypothetical protein A2X43_13180 [Candidatus Margulisbacteria bacterium GWD2_39_127]OGI05735.1 MAG: hypothetical protein A2X41_03400 [Candidatus Margulisbacteria bacterium GWE2_39_32]PZM83669.1 MAG: hypothetical protein DKM50_01965 [Candidatus Margulisiibacteriota bacterium]HAR62087.1 hypothetical protein [Candidatus Margulisiibacteriota bacterium]HCY36046.1 hypothetical protein [Candidatus Margulisiibacteriota bacterium]